MARVLSEKEQTCLRVFLAQPGDRVGEVYLRALEWAEDPEMGALPHESAKAFALWLDETWNDWAEDPGVTVRQIFEGAVEQWCGGRVMPS